MGSSALWYAKQEILNVLRRNFFRSKHPEIIHALKTDGIYVMPNFISSQECTELRVEIDRLIEQFPNKIWTDSLKCDRRVFGADEVSPLFDRYFRNAFIREVLADYEKSAEVKGFTMAARLEYVPGNLGSGNGWHRDSAHYTQTKSIVYLSNTGTENGPFEYVLGSHTPQAFIQGWMKKLYHRDQFRYSDSEISKYQKRLWVT